MSLIKDLLTIESGSLIFAIFNVAMSVVSTLFNIANRWPLLPFDLNDYTLEYDDLTNPFNMATHYIPYTGTLEMMLMMTELLTFAFAMVLLQGVRKKVPSFVKAYLIYGVVFLLLYILQASLYLVLTIKEMSSPDYKSFTLWMIVGVIDTLILIMIFRTYKKFNKSSTTVLIEKSDEECQTNSN